MARTTALCAGGAVVATMLAAVVLAQQTEQPVGLPEDWSHKRLIFSNPGTSIDMMKPGVTQGRWLRWLETQKDARYIIHLRKRDRDRALAVEQDMVANGFAPTPGNTSGARTTSSTASAPTANNLSTAIASVAALAKASNPPATQASRRTSPVQRDWSNVMGGAAGVGKPGVFPAKYNFAITTKSCAGDFVVYTTASAGVTSTGNLASRQQGAFSSSSSSGTFVITNGTRSLTLTGSVGGTNLGTTFEGSGSAATRATNLANAINRNGGTVGVTATVTGASSDRVTVTSVTAGTAGNSITLTGTLSNFTFATPLQNGTATAGQPTIFALNQLYKDTVANGGCQTATQAVPATLWSYSTGAGSTADLSPVLSWHDSGAQVAFTQRNGSNQASLVLLKWSANSGTLGVPTALSDTAEASYRACTAPCMAVIPLSGNPNVTNSSPFVDYTNDVLYVGDDSGNLHKFTGVFQGTPAEATSPWPKAVSTGNALSSPVFDLVSGLVFVGSERGASTGGQLHSVNATTGALLSSAQLAGNSSTGVSTSPIVDSAAQRVYAFVSVDTSSNCASVTCQSVYQFPTTFASNASWTSRAQIGRGQIVARVLSAGTFDNAYYQGPASDAPSGSMYVCGSASDNAASTQPTLWRIPINDGAMGTPVVGPTLVSASGVGDCSPITEVAGTTTDRIFVSVPSSGNDTGCTGACIYMYDIPALWFNTTSTSSTTNSSNRFLSVSTSAALNATEASVATTIAAATAGTYSGMTITQSANNGAGVTTTYTLRRNAADTTVVCSITAGNNSCTDTAHTQAYSSGNTIDVRVSRTGGDVTATFTVELLAGAQLSGTSTATAGLAATGGTSGIIIDNTVSGGGSQVYYSTLTSPGNAVQASRAGLN